MLILLYSFYIKMMAEDDSRTLIRESKGLGSDPLLAGPPLPSLALLYSGTVPVWQRFCLIMGHLSSPKASEISQM